jgi:hypothetical protein
VPAIATVGARAELTGEAVKSATEREQRLAGSRGLALGPARSDAASKDSRAASVESWSCLPIDMLRIVVRSSVRCAHAEAIIPLLFLRSGRL